MSPALSVTVAVVEVVAVVTPLAGVIEALVEPVAVVVDVVPEVCCEVPLPVLVVLEVLAGVELVVTGVVAGWLLCVWLEVPELDEVSAACAAGAVVINSKPEYAIASTRAATDRKLINICSPSNAFELLIHIAYYKSVPLLFGQGRVHRAHSRYWRGLQGY